MLPSVARDSLFALSVLPHISATAAMRRVSMSVFCLKKCLNACAVLFVVAIAVVFGSAQTDPLHMWVGKMDKASAETWVNKHLEQERKAVDELLAVKGARTIENTLRPYDDAQNELTLAGAESFLMYGVAPQKEVRDAGQALAEKVTQAANELQLNQSVYKALSSLDTKSADPAIKHYIERALLEYRLAGVDKDDATRAEIKKRLDHIVETALKFARNVQENVNHVVAKDKSEIRGLPDDFVSRHPAGTDGSVTFTTEETDYSPVITYATSEDLRKKMYLAYMTRAYPQNTEILMDVLRTRNELAKMLGYGTWADFATADQMIGSAANMKTFLNDV